MKCSEWEERVALYAGGDETPGVEQHLAECAACQVLLSGMRESLALMREAHAEPIEAAHFAAVRARVFAELERGHSRRWRLAWVLAMAAAVAVLLDCAAAAAGTASGAADAACAVSAACR